jgi:hypothetical protein
MLSQHNYLWILLIKNPCGEIMSMGLDKLGKWSVHTYWYSFSSIYRHKGETRVDLVFPPSHVVFFKGNVNPLPLLSFLRWSDFKKTFAGSAHWAWVANAIPRSSRATNAPHG